MINPFALHGPDFLAFYIGLGILMVALQFFLGRAIETPGFMPQLQMTDPYQIAYLRGGAAEALRITVLSLIDRGLITASGRSLVADTGAEQIVRRPIEKAVLRLYRRQGKIKKLLSDTGAVEACREYKDALVDFGLVAGPQTIARRLIPFLVSSMVLVFVGVLKIAIALSEGRHNLGFLTLLMIVFGAVCIWVFRRPRTRLGDAMMSDLRTMFGRLRSRADSLRQGGATNEAALLAAVFGVNELSPVRFPAIKALTPKEKRSDSGSSCSSCGSSSCGGGCGGGCGG